MIQPRKHQDRALKNYLRYNKILFVTYGLNKDDLWATFSATANTEHQDNII